MVCEFEEFGFNYVNIVQQKHEKNWRHLRCYKVWLKKYLQAKNVIKSVIKHIDFLAQNTPICIIKKLITAGGSGVSLEPDLYKRATDVFNNCKGFLRFNRAVCEIRTLIVTWPGQGA